MPRRNKNVRRSNYRPQKGKHHARQIEAKRGPDQHTIWKAKWRPAA